MKNKLIDIHNSLMLSLEMLDDDELFEDPEKSKVLLDRIKTKAIIAKEIVEVDRLGFAAMQYSKEELVALPNTLRISEKVANDER